MRSTPTLALNLHPHPRPRSRPRPRPRPRPRLQPHPYMPALTSARDYFARGVLVNAVAEPVESATRLPHAEPRAHTLCATRLGCSRALHRVRSASAPHWSLDSSPRSPQLARGCKADRFLGQGRSGRGGRARCCRLGTNVPRSAVLRHTPRRSTPAGSPTTRLAAAARSRAPTRRTWRRRSTTTTARRTCRAPKRPRLGAACRCRLPRARLLALVGVAPLLHRVAPGCATHAGRVEYELRGPYGREGLRSQVRGCPGATRGFGRSPLRRVFMPCGRRAQASARSDLSAPQLGR